MQIVLIIRGPYNTHMDARTLQSLTDAQCRSLEKIGVVLLYLHGSVATGRARTDSDVDIAVLFERMPKDTVAATTAIVSALTGFEIGREMDIAILNEASPLLNQMVASQGKLLYARLPDDALRFEIRAMHEYEYSRQVVRLGQELVLKHAHI